jgi:hypothetical protein
MGRLRRCTCFRRFDPGTKSVGDKDAVVQILAKAGRERLSFNQFECPGPASFTSGSQKQSVLQVPLVEAVRQFVHVSHAKRSYVKPIGG